MTASQRMRVFVASVPDYQLAVLYCTNSEHARPSLARNVASWHHPRPGMDSFHVCLCV
jgi:hypothetical protein